ncbi:MAG: hypothetical protein J5814_01945 [Bacteroidaceae bacterium]|nr:hypothetical protein [Bacteroidaceae bacterium]
MDKADFTFLIASFLYMMFALAESIGLLPDPATLGLAFILLWGIFFITTLIKSRFYLQRTGKVLNIASIVLSLMVFILSLIIIIITV